MRINLNVPFKEKDKARMLGAKWDSARKTWYVVDVDDIQPFIRWMTAQQVNPSSYKQRQREEQFYRFRDGRAREYTPSKTETRIPHLERKG